MNAIKKYDLIKHYKIDTNDSYPITRLNNKIDERISFIRTKLLSDLPKKA